MALIVGNLFTDPEADSFISLDAAKAYLKKESWSDSTGPVQQWLDLDTSNQEALLVSASRWLMTTFNWCKFDYSAAELRQIGFIAARMAVAAKDIDLYAVVDFTKRKQSVKAGSASVTYANASQYAEHVSGLHWPWLMPMLKPFICNPRLGLGVFVV